MRAALRSGCRARRRETGVSVLLVGALATVALVLTATALLRLSRMPIAEPIDLAARTFETLVAGDVVMTLRGDFVVEDRARLGEGDGAADLFALRSGRDRCFLVVPKEGALSLLDQRPASREAAVEAARAPGVSVERPTVDLLPGT